MNAFSGFVVNRYGIYKNMIVFKMKIQEVMNYENNG